MLFIFVFVKLKYLARQVAQNIGIVDFLSRNSNMQIFKYSKVSGPLRTPIFQFVKKLSSFWSTLFPHSLPPPPSSLRLPEHPSPVGGAFRPVDFLVDWKPVLVVSGKVGLGLKVNRH